MRRDKESTENPGTSRDGLVPHENIPLNAPLPTDFPNRLKYSPKSYHLGPIRRNEVLVKILPSIIQLLLRGRSVRS